MLVPGLVEDKKELQQILSLQSENLSHHISPEELLSQGFVTIRHDINTLLQLHALAPSVIVKDKGIVAGYALTMLKECRQLIPGLESMFAVFDQLSWNAKPLNQHNFYIMGQICVARPYRGRGLVELLYQFHKECYGTRYELLVTEIATRNKRSLRAHEKAGFKTIHIHEDQMDEWAVVAWDWSR